MVGRHLLDIVDLLRLLGQLVHAPVRGEGEVVVSGWGKQYLMLLLIALRAGSFTISLVSPSKMLELCFRS